MDCFDGKGPPKMVNEILLHLAIRSSGGLFHYVLVKKWEFITAQIVRLQCLKLKKMCVSFVGASKFCATLI